MCNRWLIGWKQCCSFDGTVVLKNVKDDLVMIGNPAREVVNSGKVFK